MNTGLDGNVVKGVPKWGRKPPVGVKGSFSSLMLSLILVGLIGSGVGFVGGFLWGYDRGLDTPVTIYEEPVDNHPVS